RFARVVLDIPGSSRREVPLDRREVHVLEIGETGTGTREDDVVRRRIAVDVLDGDSGETRLEPGARTEHRLEDLPPAPGQVEVGRGDQLGGGGAGGEERRNEADRREERQLVHRVVTKRGVKFHDRLRRLPEAWATALERARDAGYG